MGKFDKFLDEKQTENIHVPLERKRALQTKTSSNTLRSVKITSETYQLVNLIKMNTNKKQLEIMKEALEVYTELLAKENQALKGMCGVWESKKDVADGQTSVYDFL